MRSLDPASRAAGFAVSIMILVLLLPAAVRAQAADTFQRVYPRSVADVKTAVQNQKATSRGRLPTLEGFVVDQASPSLDHYEKGFYESAFDVAPAIGGGTLVTVTTKITAFLNDPTTGVSGYRVLASNGRLENDALDRIEETLNPGATAAAIAVAETPTTAAPSSGGLRPAHNFNATGPAYGDAPGGTFSNSSPGGESSSRASTAADVTRAPRTPIAPATPLPSGESLETLRAKDAADAQKTRELTAYIKNLEDVQHNQARPANLAAVRKPKTPVYAKAVEGSGVLLTADADDEFEILEVSGPWVHVRISGASRGWMRRTQVEMPPGYAQAAASPERETPASPSIFKVSKEETNPFRGNWEPLKGKTVRVEWIEASLPSSSPADKLAYAKSVFLNAFQAVNVAHENVEGIVVVFDSADGGQISAGLASVKGLAEKNLSESAFWRQCLLDPPDSFQVSVK
jgi:hypothetical protein